MIYFSQRKEIENKYREWIKENDLPDCAFNVITFLAGAGLLVETMDAAEFIVERKRMCDSFTDTCHGCPIHKNFPRINCSEILKRQPLKVIGLVKQWSEDHKE